MLAFLSAEAMLILDTGSITVKDLETDNSPTLESRHTHRRAAAQFAGKLYTATMLRKAVIHSFIEQLLPSDKLISEPKLEYLCALLSVVGHTLHSGPTSSKASRALMDNCISRMTTVRKVNYLSTRVSSMLQVGRTYFSLEYV